MNNWRLLLFAVLCIFHPISSEENLFNGRERCLQQRSDSSRKDTRISAYEYLTTPTSEIRRVNTRKEIRTIPEQRETEKDSSRTRRRLASQREGLSQEVRENDRRIRTNDRVSLVSRQRYNAETTERRSLLRNDRTESQIRNIREERRTDTEFLIRDRRLTSRQETNARSFRSREINDNDRRTYEREVPRARITSSKNTESLNIPARRNTVQREYDNVQHRLEPNVRLERNVNKISKQKAEIVQRDEDESRHLKRELRANRDNANNRMNLETSRRNSERLVLQNLRDVRQNERPNVRAQAIRTNYVNTHFQRSADVNDNRRNDIRRTITDFRRQDTERKVQNDFRREMETRVRRDVDTDRRNNRGEQIGQNKADARDATVRVARREQRPSLGTNIRDSRMEKRDRELNRDHVIRSQRRLNLERQNKNTRFTSRNTRIENADFNRIANERIRVVPIKQTDRNLADNYRLETNVLRQRNLEGIRNIKQDKRQHENLENSQRRVNRAENRMTRSMSNRFRQNMERDNGQRLRSVEAIRVNGDNEMRENIRRSIPLNDRFANKIVRDESTRLSRTNEFSTKTSGVTSETYFTFELQYLFYIIQAVYLISIFRKSPKNKEGFEKKLWFGSWKTPIVMKMD